MSSALEFCVKNILAKTLYSCNITLVGLNGIILKSREKERDKGRKERQKHFSLTGEINGPLY
jgi:hypothetical protein